MSKAEASNAKCRAGWHQRGMSLLELSVVLLILAGLAGMALPYLGGAGRTAACQATDATLATVRDAIIGSGATPGYLSDMGDFPYYLDTSMTPRHDTLHFLFANSLSIGATTYYANGLAAGDSRLQFNPATRRGWHGPYLLNGVTIAGQSAVLDSFHPPQCTGDCRSPVILQLPGGNASYARLVSVGPDGVLQTVLTDLAASSRGDDRVLFLQMADPGRNQPCAD